MALPFFCCARLIDQQSACSEWYLRGFGRQGKTQQGVAGLPRAARQKNPRHHDGSAPHPNRQEFRVLCPHGVVTRPSWNTRRWVRRLWSWSLRRSLSPRRSPKRSPKRSPQRAKRSLSAFGQLYRKDRVGRPCPFFLRRMYQLRGLIEVRPYADGWSWFSPSVERDRSPPARWPRPPSAPAAWPHPAAARRTAWRPPPAAAG